MFFIIVYYLFLWTTRIFLLNNTFIKLIPLSRINLKDNETQVEEFPNQFEEALTKKILQKVFSFCKRFLSPERKSHIKERD